ncbi:MAG: L-iditol 2-dehydrogenase [Mesorhizobium sp.]|uniref:L-iditol 2-dehydrogenase n=1 Tax=Mesorhizobium sp. TaxID=1871066 RepID=UPI000FE5A1B3|nr:L-iditol 2-dehydrogenase [Mesorhizobium sp.]RWD24935.1 MAG: L-iditol 2-dehydrogenase [Mesorhizobium sp.]
MKLNNKTALITGGARGIGLGFAQAYAREGAKVVIADIDFERATQAAAATGPAASAKKLDGSDLAAIESVAAEVDREFGGIDILVNNAAIFDMAPITVITEASYEKVFGINLKGPLFMMKAVAKLMIARGRGGKIINMASQAGRRGEALVTLYCASKAAIISATQSAALALVKHGINVNAIAPGVVDGEHWDVVDAHFARWEGLKPGEKKAAVAKSVPIGRFATPGDIAGLAVFLASSDSDYILAQTYNVDGGNWMS